MSQPSQPGLRGSSRPETEPRGNRDGDLLEASERIIVIVTPSVLVGAEDLAAGARSRGPGRSAELTLSLTNLTEPSAKAKFAPPGCRLRKAHWPRFRQAGTLIQSGG